MPDRKPLIAGNWKMHLSVAEAVELVRRIAAQTEDAEGVEVLVAPPFTTLYAVREALGDSRIRLGAQNMHWEMSGAFTGEISGRMLQGATCTHVILGHSERRTLFNDTNETVDLKVRSATFLGLIPIVCVGETLEEREAGNTFDVLKTQLDGSLRNFK
ncbi:MAG: triose-phosphate isomerase, partial [Deltaproteobacteria bacterium]